MCQWAITERSVDSVIANALELRTDQFLIFSSILQVNQKIRILLSLINISWMDDSDKEHFKSQIKNLEKLSVARNLVAHCAFGPTDDQTAVVFLKVEVKSGELKFPNITWTRQEFDCRFEALENLTSECQCLSTKLKQALGNRELAEAIAGVQPNLWTTQE